MFLFYFFLIPSKAFFSLFFSEKQKKGEQTPTGQRENFQNGGNFLRVGL